MPRPIVKFEHDLPLEFKPNEALEVKLKVFPRVVGKCHVNLLLNASSVQFEDDTSEMTLEVEAVEEDDKLDCVFNVILKSTDPKKYFFLLNAFAVNAEETKSFVKPTEAELDARESSDPIDVDSPTPQPA